MDFVSVGGGVYGPGTAWELAKRGAEVILLEAILPPLDADRGRNIEEEPDAMIPFPLGSELG